MESGADQGVLHHFLSGRNLRKVFSYLCNHTSGHSVDPISDVAYTMLTCPVEMMVSEVCCTALLCVLWTHVIDVHVLTRTQQVGVALFKGKPSVLYPFTEMDADQLYYVEALVARCMEHHQKIVKQGDGLEDANSASNTVPPINSKVIMQMGGGCILYIEPPPKQQHTSVVAVSPPDVMAAVCDCIFASER